MTPSRWADMCASEKMARDGRVRWVQWAPFMRASAGGNATAGDPSPMNSTRGSLMKPGREFKMYSWLDDRTRYVRWGAGEPYKFTSIGWFLAWNMFSLTHSLSLSLCLSLFLSLFLSLSLPLSLSLSFSLSFSLSPSPSLLHSLSLSPVSSSSFSVHSFFKKPDTFSASIWQLQIFYSGVLAETGETFTAQIAPQIQRIDIIGSCIHYHEAICKANNVWGPREKLKWEFIGRF